jgi:hypothetical protein
MPRFYFMILKEFVSVSKEQIIAVRNPGELYYTEDPRIKELVAKGLVMMDFDIEERK